MTEPVIDELDARLSTPLSTIMLPTRLANVLERRGVRSVAELVRLSPEELLLEKNLGRKSVYEARFAIRDVLGTSWDDARRHLLGREGIIEALAPTSAEAVNRPPTQTGRWETLRARLAVVAHTRLEQMEFPARVYTFAGARGVETLGQLLAVSWEDFSKAKNVGRGTIAATLGILEAFLDRVPEDQESASGTSATDSVTAVGASSPCSLPIPRGARWTTLLREALAKLEGQERIIATQRSGLAGPIPTLQELGDCFGVSRERVRQIESRAIDRLRRRLPRAEASRRLTAVCEVLVEDPHVVVTRDSLFAFDAEEVLSLSFFVNDVLAEDVHALVVDERLVFSRAGKSALATLLRRTHTLLEAASFPMEEEELARSIAAALDVGVADARALFGYVREPLLREGTRVVGFGRQRDDEILATLRGAAGPVARAAIEAQHGRGRLPEEAIFVDHGLISVPERIEGWYRWARRLPPLVRDLIEREGPERQWTTAELLELLAAVCELPEWMNAWTLGSLLRRASEVEYLGRNVVALRADGNAGGGEDAEAKRVYIAPALEEILRTHGAPMPEEEAREALAKIRGVSTNAWNMMRMKRPFLLLDGGMLGLYPRDVPGGEARVAQVLGALYEWLFVEQKGVPGPDVARFLSELGDVADGFSSRMLRSVARLDGRFRLSVSGAVGLAEWESVRVPTQAEVLEELLHEGGGSVPVDVVRARVLTAAGEPIPRPNLANLAVSVGARLDGDVVVRRAVNEDAAHSPLVARVLTELPERTAAVFEGLLDAALRAPASLDAESLVEELAAWAATLRRRAATDAPHVEVEQVDAIEADARTLLAVLGTFEGDARTLAVAAVRYVICTDDADSDFAVGGLDDDEAVLRRVSTALGTN